MRRPDFVCIVMSDVPMWLAGPVARKADGDGDRRHQNVYDLSGHRPAPFHAAIVVLLPAALKRV
jgi:hypothetical protein